MVDSDSHENGRRSGVSRRRFVQAAGASGVAVGLAGCISSGDGDGGSGDGGDGGNGSSDGGSIDTSTPEGDITVKWAGDSRMADNAQGFNDALHNAGLSENITVEIIAGSQVTDNRQSQYQQWLSSGREEPVLMQMDSGWTIPFILRDQLQNLSSALPSELTSTVEENYFGASIETAKHPESGDLYGIPLFPDFPTIQYRKDLFKEAGYTEDDFSTWATESMSWPEFSKKVAEVKEATGTQYGFNFQASIYEGLSCCDFNEFMTSFGGAYFGELDNLFGPVGDRPITVDEEPVLESIRMVRSLIHGPDAENAMEGVEQVSPEAVLQWTEEPSRQPFTNGNAVALRNWPYSITINGAEDAFGEDLGVMPIPWGVEPGDAKYEGTGGPVAALGGWHVALNPNASDTQKQAAVQVMQTLTKEQFQLEIFGLMGWIPARPELLNSDQAQEVDIIGRYLNSLKVAGENAVPRPVTAVWPQQSGKVAQEVNNAYAGKKSPEKAMSDLKATLEQIEDNA